DDYSRVYSDHVRCDFFFFQAEDGIRDRNVTGVQTCALPIFISGASPTTTTKVNENGLPIAKEPTSITETMLHTVVQMQVYHEGRSEERRVGKESRSRWWTGVRQKKTRKREKYEKIGNDKTR